MGRGFVFVTERLGHKDSQRDVLEALAVTNLLIIGSV